MKLHAILHILTLGIFVSCSNTNSIIGKSVTNIDIEDVASNFTITKLNKYHSDSLKLIFRIPQKYCSSCINREIATLKNLLKETKMPLFITSFDNKRDVLIFAKSHGISLTNICNKKGELFHEFSETDPYYILLDKLMIVKSVSVLTKSNNSELKNFLANSLFANSADISFSSSSFVFGNIPQGQPKTVAFAFENRGKVPLVIYSAEASCGCTQPKYPKEPIAPGEKGEIKVTYDAKEPGRFVKTVTVYHNGANGMDLLTIKGTVEEPVAAQQ